MYLAHIPLNHHLRPLYRLLAGLSSLYLLGWGIVGLIEASGVEAFARDGLPKVLGQNVNPASAVLHIMFGATITVACVLGRNIDHYVNFWAGQALLVIGLASLAFIRTDANILGFNIVNVIVLWTVATLVLAGSLYGKVGPREPVDADGAEHGSARHAAAH